VAENFNHFAPVNLLLQHGASVNRKDAKGYTSLHYAIEMGHKTIVDMLMKHRADVNAADNFGRTPLHLASKRNDMGKENIMQTQSQSSKN